jgi:Kef-type K+ transport system membrane component KefB
MRIPILGTEIDERFFRHRQRSTSIAGLVGAWVAVGIFVYRYFANGVTNWDLIAVAVAMGAVKLALMTWYFITD